MAGYDAKKAATFNRLRQQGLTEDQAAAQAGIGDSDFGNYSIGDNGQMGPTIAGGGKKAGVDFERYSPQEEAESARFTAGLSSSKNFEQVDFQQTPRSTPNTTKPITYTTTSTQTVSGGGSTTITAGPRQATAESRALGTAYDAKQAEYNQFIKDNPSDFARRRQGLPPLTPEEAQQRQATLDRLNNEKVSLKNQQIDAESPGQPTITTTPNTTTTQTTVTTAVVTPVAEPVNEQNDQQLFNQVETEIDSAVPEPVTAEAEPVDDALLTPDGNLETGEVAETGLSEPEPVDAADDPLLTPDGEEETGETALTGLSEPEPVDAADDPGLRTPDGEEETGDAADTGLREPTEEDVAAAEQENAIETRRKLDEAQQQATIQQRYNQTTRGDWRVRLRLAPGANYLYRDPNNRLLTPLRNSDGVIFPYTPSIQTNFAANYDRYDLTHSNYRGYFYKNSTVGDITVSGTFTAQDSQEAEYLLAVIVFLRSATKMFYGKDEYRGAPPPIVELSGLGEYQFNNHPCLIGNFQYSLPNDVDYISVMPNNQGITVAQRQPRASTSPISTIQSVLSRLSNAGLPQGGQPGRGDLGAVGQTVSGTGATTYVPTKMDITITLLPVQTRQQVSQTFSVKNFANGNLLKGGFW